MAQWRVQSSKDTPTACLHELLRAERVVVDHNEHQVLGGELGEDVLHVYKRLLVAINLHARGVAWGIRRL